MKISLSPQRRDEPLKLERYGDVLIINGVRFDFSPLQENDILPRAAVDCAWIVSDIKRRNGVLELTLILPHGRNAPLNTRFPTAIIDPPDGLVQLPRYDMGDETDGQ